MKSLSAVERRFVTSVVGANARLIFTRRRKSRRNPGMHGDRRFVPQRISIEPDEAARMIRVNTFIAKALNFMGKKLREGSAERAHIRLRILHLRDLNRMIRSKLLRPGRRGSVVLTGAEAAIYFNTLELVHKAFSAIRMNYIQSSTDIARATEEAGDRWWDIRSLINVGHLPLKDRPDRFGR